MYLTKTCFYCGGDERPQCHVLSAEYQFVSQIWLSGYCFCFGTTIFSTRHIDTCYGRNKTEPLYGLRSPKTSFPFSLTFEFFFLIL